MQLALTRANLGCRTRERCAAASGRGTGAGEAASFAAKRAPLGHELVGPLDGALLGGRLGRDDACDGLPHELQVCGVRLNRADARIGREHRDVRARLAAERDVFERRALRQAERIR